MLSAVSSRHAESTHIFKGNFTFLLCSCILFKLKKTLKTQWGMRNYLPGRMTGNTWPLQFWPPRWQNSSLLQRCGLSLWRGGASVRCQRRRGRLTRVEFPLVDLCSLRPDHAQHTNLPASHFQPRGTRKYFDQPSLVLYTLVLGYGEGQKWASFRSPKNIFLGYLWWWIFKRCFILK